eukprot:g17709.t1
MVRAVKIVIWFPVLAIADLGEMADSYFASMSSPAITPLCKESKVCCPNSQCVPGLETFSGCKAERGPVRCDAAEMSSGFPLKNGICRQQLSILRAAKAFPPPLSPEVALMAIRVKLENAYN